MTSWLHMLRSHKVSAIRHDATEHAAEAYLAGLDAMAHAAWGRVRETASASVSCVRHALACVLLMRVADAMDRVRLPDDEPVAVHPRRRAEDKDVN